MAIWGNSNEVRYDQVSLAHGLEKKLQRELGHIILESC